MQHANQHQHITLESSELGTCCLSEITSTHHISLSLSRRSVTHSLGHKIGVQIHKPQKKNTSADHDVPTAIRPTIFVPLIEQ